MLTRDMNLITGATDLYYSEQAKASRPYPKKLISFLMAALIAETAALGYYAVVNGSNFKFVPDIPGIIASLPRPAFTEFDMFKPRGTVLGSATASADIDRLESANNVSSTEATPSATPEPTVAPTSAPTAIPTVEPTPTPESDMTIYTVKNGDNWWQIVKKTCGTASDMGNLVNYNVAQNIPTLHRGDNVKVYCTIP